MYQSNRTLDLLGRMPRGGLPHKKTEPFPPWQLQAEGTIRELKKGTGSKMVRAVAPKLICYYALEFEAYVRSHTSLDVYMLQGGGSLRQ